MALVSSRYRNHWSRFNSICFDYYQSQFYLPMAMIAAYGFLSIRFDDTSILDFIKYACNFFALQQQYYVWQKQEEKGE